MTVDPHNVPPECAAAIDLLPAYLLGAVDETERQLVETCLQRSVVVREEFKKYQRVTEGMLLSVPQMPAPQEVRERLRQLTAPTAINPRQTPRAAATTPLRVVEPHPLRALRLGLVAGLVLLLVGTNLLWWQQVQRLQEQANATPPAQVVLISAGTDTTAPLNQVALIADQSDVPAATLAWTTAADDQTWLGMFTVRQLPVLEKDIYQLWLIREGENPLSLGVFNVGGDGSGFMLFQISEPIGTFDRVGITTEPNGGSPAPTSPLLLTGDI